RAPGQATSYFVGYQSMLETRQRAELALGGRLDRQRFHDFILAQGLLPPDLRLRAVLEEFVPGEKSRAAANRPAPPAKANCRSAPARKPRRLVPATRPGGSVHPGAGSRHPLGCWLAPAAELARVMTSFWLSIQPFARVAPWIILAAAAVVFPVLFFVPAPYGR